ncbi:50S ribosomal protein L32e [Candidatus Woesearchaeota archaeon CG11_big_fil_rev_8_21_14_0_20_43_8]|nr:MAG: 50S ribosomal protein L32e [Candidatus Woesearchaeota archaeon CG11_big_fil_rev_8_21_14_0_20_43_8]PIO08941.1 MAG: 50S ribosomal protein L32e [Candidatus Woesearchaeota archaeon CG08_land_8_20_14_0_20_43_7]
METALKIRKAIKAKKPKYARQCSHKVKEVSRTGWRKPKGKHSKIRKQKKNKTPLVQPGFGSPSIVKGLLSDGLKPVLVMSSNDLTTLDKKTDGAIVAAKTGMRKRLEIIKKAKELGITLVNIKNPEDYAKSYIENKDVNKKEKQKKKETREKKAKEVAKKKEKEETIEKKVEKTEEEKKKEENKKREELLTQKQKD